MEQLDQNKKRENLQKEKNQIFRLLPRVDDLMKKENVQRLAEKEGYERVLGVVRDSVENLRNEISQGIKKGISEHEAKEMIQKFLYEIESSSKKSEVNHLLEQEQKKEIQPVYNGTGVILHTGLGRATLSHEIAEKLKAVAENYSSLEYDLQTGKRGNRTGYAEELLCQITGAEAAIVVNNNAGAVLLALSALTKGGEVIVSRGELVEIGGKFRIPDVMEQSGATLVEVGTTNKTHYDDYKNAITEETKALLKVHTSNYRIVGFTESVEIDELIGLAGEHELPIIEDLGSGVLIDLAKYGLTHEPMVQESIAKGADVVCFSGDKLLGGPQAGIIIGKKKYIDRMKKNQLTRALRIDKFTATALELVLQEYLSEENAMKNIPVLRMITEPKEEMEKKAKNLVRMLRRTGFAARFQVMPCESQIGGGSLPLERIPSYAAAISPEEMSVPELEEKMRHLPVPIIPRTANDTILLDVRTIDSRQFKVIADQFRSM